MTISTYEDFREKELVPFAEELKSKYYAAAQDLSAKARKQIEKINRLESSEAPLQYVMLCERVLNETDQYINNRQSVYIPYVLKLSDKVAEDHNCANCSGNCKIEHDSHVLELNATNDLIRQVLSKLKMASLPLYSETTFPDEFRVLRAHMTLLENHITELVFLENTYLIPKIREAQKSINALSK